MCADLADAEEHERRVERQRGEGVRRHPADVAVHFGGDDRDAGHEMTDGLPEGAGVECVGHYRFFITTLTSFGLMRSGTVQPSRSYSAMHCSAKPL